MKIGIALSGGGIRGIAHAGVLKALEENNISISLVGGTSSGSLVATLYAMGYSPYYIYILFKRYAPELCNIPNSSLLSEIRRFIFKRKFQINGLNDGLKLEQEYNKIADKKGIKCMKDIKMPLFIPTVDVSNSQKYVFTSFDSNEDEHYINDISVGKAVRASSSFPVVFMPLEYKNHLFIDGGVLDNIPVGELKKHGADKVIAVRFDSDTVDKKSNMMDVAMKTIDIMGNKLCDEQLDQSDFIITIPSDGTGLLEIDKMDFCYKSGYNKAIKCMDAIKNLLYT